MADFPVPVKTPESAPFFEAAAAGRFILRRCVSCGQSHWYPRFMCPFCHGQTEWVEASGRGKIHTFSTFSQQVGAYTLAYVELDEGPIMLTQLVNVEPASLRIDDPVRVRFQQAPDGTAIACFEPASWAVRAACPSKGGDLDKSIASLAQAVAGVADGATVLIGGFGGAGAPVELIHGLIARYLATGHPTDLTVVNNNAGTGGVGLGALIRHGMVKKLICSFPRSSDPKAFNERYAAGTLELELVPQGTLAERIRAAGAGIPAFYTRTAYGTELAAGKPVAEFDGVMYVQERALKADVALVKAHYGDRHGNLTYRFAARNFAPLMCMAATHAIAQVEHLVEPGMIHPEHVVTPGIFVQSVVEVTDPVQEEVLVRSGASYP